MLTKLIFKNIKKNIGITILAIITLVIVIFSFTIIDFIYTNIQKLWIEESGWNNKNKVIITKKYDGFLKSLVNNNTLDNLYTKLKNNENIEKSYAFYSTKIPVSANINFMGFDFNTDTFVYATDKFQASWDNLILWISSTILNIYNTQFSNDSMFPKLNNKVLEKINIELIFGKNSFFELKNIISKEWTIKYIDNDFPLFWLTLAKNQIDKIEKKLNIKTLKVYKIITFVKNPNYIDTLKKRYPNFNIQWYNDIEQKVNNKLKSIKYTFNIIKVIIYIILVAFIIVLCILIIQKNKNNLKVLYYNGASKFKQFSIIFWEISFYMVVSISTSFLWVFIINQQIPKINKIIEEKWIINIKIQNIQYSKLLETSLFLYFTLLLISYGLFTNNFKKWEQI